MFIWSVLLSLGKKKKDVKKRQVENAEKIPTKIDAEKQRTSKKQK